jgi:hypothetical protein
MGATQRQNPKTNFCFYGYYLSRYNLYKHVLSGRSNISTAQRARDGANLVEFDNLLVCRDDLAFSSAFFQESISGCDKFFRLEFLGW